MSTEDEGTRPGGDHQVGSLGEEALRLVGALSGWVAQHGTDTQHGAEEILRQASEGVQQMAHGFEDHLATGAAECTWCPICRSVHAVRTLSPEVKSHLTSAAASLVKAAAALMATPPPGPASGADDEPRVQRIRFDDDEEPTP